jgi:membrane fusion protein, multidrug efflux system
VSQTEKLPVKTDLTSLHAPANQASSGGRKRHTFRARLRLTRKKVLSWVRQHILIALVGALVATYILFWVFTQFFVFCRDAYVKTDVVQVAPEVSGPILKLEVGDNDRVVANAVLFQIDPEPFQIALRTQQAALALAQADLEKAQRQVGLAESQLAAREATLSDAQKTMDRIAELFRGGEASALTMDNARKAYKVASADVQEAQSARAVAFQEIIVRGAVVAQAQAGIAKADFELRKTTVRAPVPGQVAPLKVRLGAYVSSGVVAIAIVSSQNWRVVANLPERNLLGLKVGRKVWFSVSSDPWRFHRGTIRSISTGISRSSESLQALPYVEPTVDWIRLPRRFPVEIDLGKLPEFQQLYQGADASVIILPNFK